MHSPHCLTIDLRHVRQRYWGHRTVLPAIVVHAAALSTPCPDGDPRPAPGCVASSVMLDRPSTEVQLSLCLAVGAALFLDFLLVTMVIPIFPSMMPRAEMRAGILFAAKPLAQVLCNPLAAMLDHSVALRVGTILGALGALTFGLANGFAALLAIRLAQGAASAGVMTGGMSLLMSSHAESARPQAEIGRASCRERV